MKSKSVTSRSTESNDSASKTASNSDARSSPIEILSIVVDEFLVRRRPLAVLSLANLPSGLYFLRIGHCLWAWLLALIGGFLARHFYLVQERKAS